MNPHLVLTRSALLVVYPPRPPRFSQLNEFSTRVSLAPSAAVGEFFEPPAKRGQSADRSADGADTSEAIPAAELLPMQTGTLKARD